MQVIRDETWQQCLASAVKMFRLSEPDDKCYHLADATWKCKMSYKKHEEKKESRQVIVIDKLPESVVTQRTHVKTCQATTMSGKPCSFKAVCGDFCKKHRIDKVPIGKKVQLKS
jgi:hypothetical protein